MKIAELREAFVEAARIADIAKARYDRGGLPDCWVEYVGNLADMVLLLTDETPITEEGLRELGFEGSVETEFYAGELRGWFDDGRFFFYNCMQYPKSMGKLRGLLLFVGEQ